MPLRRRLANGLLLPAFLITLVGVLATLQFRWLGQASEADREQMRRAINERAQAFADHLDREISSAASALFAEYDVDSVDAAARAGARLQGWREASEFPDLVRTLYISRLETGRRALYAFDADRGTVERVEWPERLAPVREHLAPDSSAMFLPNVRRMFVSEVPAVFMPPSGVDERTTILELDVEALRRSVFPSLVATYFPGQSSGPYRVAILDADEQRIFSAGHHAEGLTGENADAVAALFEPGAVRRTIPSERDALTLHQGVAVPGPGQRVDLVVRRIGPPQGELMAASAVRRMFMVSSGTTIRVRGLDNWAVLVQHPLGSIDAAVDAGRRRNLWVSFGILGVLATGLALVVVNARRAEQLAVKQMEFVATVSHELRTPVAVMRSAAQNLSAGVVSGDERARRYGELIENEGRRLTEMVEQVLEFAGGSAERQPAVVRSVNLTAITRDALDACRQLAESHGVVVEADLEREGEAIVQGDPEALRRAVTNLLTNALKHGAEGRWVGVTIRRAQRSERNVEIAVSDRGPGVDSSDLPHLFEPFYRGVRAVEGQVPGNGLGLSLVQRIVAAHRGRVSVASSPGRGATFTMHLPA